MDDDSKTIANAIKFVGIPIVAIVFFVIFWNLAIAPVYNVWAAGQAGKATLQQADYDRQTKVVEAQANLQAQKFNAEAEVARAQGVAQSNNIVKGTITDQYIRYLWVQTLENNKGNQIIYVPTEMGLPLTEAGRAVTPTGK